MLMFKLKEVIVQKYTEDKEADEMVKILLNHHHSIEEAKHVHKVTDGYLKMWLPAFIAICLRKPQDEQSNCASASGK